MLVLPGSYPALLLDGLDEWRTSHGLHLDDVVVQKHLDVVHSRHDADVLQWETDGSVRAVRPVWASSTPVLLL